MRKAPEVRYIKPETICIGDTIRVTTKMSDSESSIVGKVARREVLNHATEYYTANGVVLVTHWRYQANYFTVTLLERPHHIGDIELFGIDILDAIGKD